MFIGAESLIVCARSRVDEVVEIQVIFRGNAPAGGDTGPSRVAGNNAGQGLSFEGALFGPYRGWNRGVKTKAPFQLA